MKKIYVAFDADTDIKYFRTLQMWMANKNIDFEYGDAHELNSARDDSERESILAQLRKRLAISDVFMILIGENTKRLTKFVAWEIEAVIKRSMPIIVVNLNGKNNCDYELTPKSLINEKLVVGYGPFKLDYISNAIDMC